MFFFFKKLPKQNMSRQLNYRPKIKSPIKCIQVLIKQEKEMVSNIWCVSKIFKSLKVFKY